MSSSTLTGSKRAPKRISSAALDRLARQSAEKNNRVPSGSDRRLIRAVVVRSNKPRDGAGGRRSTMSEGIGQTNGEGNANHNNPQEMELPAQSTKRPGIASSTLVDAVASSDPGDAATVYLQVGVGSGSFPRIASNANMEPSASYEPPMEAAMPQSPSLGNDSTESSGHPQHSHTFAHDGDGGEGLHRGTDAGGGDTEEEAPQQMDAETTPNAIGKKPSKEKSEWEDKYILSGFPHPKDDPPADEELSSLCKTHPNHLNRSRLDPFIQWDWTEKLIIESMDDKIIERMQSGEIPGCTNFRETLSRRLRARRKVLGPEGIAELRAAPPKQPAHKRGTSKQSGMLDAEKYAARMEAEKQKKLDKAAAKAAAKLAKTQQQSSQAAMPTKVSDAAKDVYEAEARQDGNIAADQLKNVAATVAAHNDLAFSIGAPEFGRAEQMIQHLRGFRAVNAQANAKTARTTSTPPTLKRIQTADAEEATPKRVRFYVVVLDNIEAVESATTRAPPIRVPGSENFSSYYLKNNNIMEPETTPGVRKHLMPETVAERCALSETTRNLTERRTWSRAFGCWEIEMLDEYGDVVDEYLEKHGKNCPCCAAWR